MLEALRLFFLSVFGRERVTHTIGKCGLTSHSLCTSFIKITHTTRCARTSNSLVLCHLQLFLFFVCYLLLFVTDVAVVVALTDTLHWLVIRLIEVGSVAAWTTTETKRTQRMAHIQRPLLDLEHTKRVSTHPASIPSLSKVAQPAVAQRTPCTFAPTALHFLNLAVRNLFTFDFTKSCTKVRLPETKAKKHKLKMG